jgi:hypothetical protein
MSGPLSPKLDWSLANPKWAASLNPILAKPLTSSQTLKGIVLAEGSNVILHKLARQMQGWYITDLNAAVTIYRSAPFNSTTLTLTASGAATVNIEVF